MTRSRSTMRATQAAILLTAGASVSCSWTRFDEVSKDSPVVALKRPGKLESGFGVALASAAFEEDDKASVRVLSIGSPPNSPGAVFELGVGESPGVDAVDTGHCDPELDPCVSITTPVGLGKASAGGVRTQCFVTGVGSANKVPGLVGRCQDTVNYALPVPDSVFPFIVEPALLGESVDEAVFLATDRAEAPAIVAGVPTRQVAFYYEPLDEEQVGRGRVPVLLEVPGGQRDDSFGATLASLRIPGGRVFAIGAPEESHVWLFRWLQTERDPAFIGCLGGIEGLGRALASGPVDEDDVDELVISDAVNVNVLNGAALASLPVTDQTSCSLAALPEGGLIASFGCGSTKGIEGCAKSNFGHALAVGDLDGDGDGEVVVGAPGMTTRGESRAGALVVYDVEGELLHEFKEVLFASSAEENDGLGTAIVTPRIEGRDVVVASGPPNEKVMIFYCPEMLPDELREASSRCE